MMSSLTLNYLKFSSVLKCSKELSDIANTQTGKQRKEAIKKAKDCVINAISEIAVNCLKGNYPLKSCDFDKLKLYKKHLVFLSKPLSISRRRKYLVQKGGFLNLLIPPALSFLGSLALDLIKEQVKKKSN